MPDPDPDAVVHLPIDGVLDLRAFAPGDIPDVVADDCDAGLDLTHVRLVHGRGVQRGIVRQARDRHPAVSAFDDGPGSHPGASIVWPRPR